MASPDEAPDSSICFYNSVKELQSLKLAPWNSYKPEEMYSPSVPTPADGGWFLLSGPPGAVAVWESTPFRMAPIPYPLHEFMYILEGEAIVYDAEGSVAVHAKAGDCFFLPQDVVLSWSNPVPIRKLFHILAVPPSIARAEAQQTKGGTHRGLYSNPPRPFVIQPFEHYASGGSSSATQPPAASDGGVTGGDTQGKKEFGEVVLFTDDGDLFSVTLVRTRKGLVKQFFREERPGFYTIVVRKGSLEVSTRPFYFSEEEESETGGSADSVYTRQVEEGATVAFGGDFQIDSYTAESDTCEFILVRSQAEMNNGGECDSREGGDDDDA